MVMRRQRIVIVALGLLLGALAAGYVFLARYDFSSLKPEIARRAKAATGRELAVGGDIHVKIGFSPVLTADNVTLQNAPWGSQPEMVRIKRLEVQVALFPLVFGRTEFDRLVLVEPELLLETDASGQSNLPFDSVKEIPLRQEKSESPLPEPPPRSLALGNIEVEKGIVEYRDARSGVSRAVAVEQLVTTAAGPDDPIAVRGKGAADGKSFEFLGTVGPLSNLIEPRQTWTVKLTVMVSGITVTLEGDVRDARHAGDYTLDVAAHGPSAADLIRMVKVGSGPELGPFHITMKVVGRKERFAIEKLDVEVGLEELVAWQFTGHIADPVAERGAEIDFRVFGKDLAMVGRLARRPIPIEGPFKVSGHVSDLAGRVYRLSEFELAAGENRLAGSLQLDFRADRPAITGTIAADRLDLRPFLATGKDEKPTDGISTRTAKGGRVFSHEPLSLERFKKIDAKLQIGARQVLTPRLVIADLAAGMVLDNEALILDPFTAAVGGGTLNGRIALHSEGKTVRSDAAVTVKGMDVDVIARELQLAERPGGKLDLDFKGRGQGGSIAEIMAGLSGKTLLLMSRGRFDNKYLQLLGGDLSSNLLRLLKPFSHTTSQVEFNCFVSGFEMREGIAHSTALVMDNDYLTVVGEGTVNLKTEELDLSFKPTPKEGVGVSGGGKVSLGLGELARPFKLGGTLARPAMVFDPTQAAVSVGKTVGEAVLFGPAAIVAFLANGRHSAENACLAAVESAQRGVKAPKSAFEKVEDTARKTLDSAHDTLKKMFGK